MPNSKPVSTSWKPGQSGNKDGRPPKGYSITEWFKNMLNSNPEVRDAMGKSIVKKALEGDTVAQKMVWSYMDGMPKQPIDHSGRVELIPLIQVNEIRRDNSDQED